MDDMTNRTVGEVARELGITVRTLHHYDRIGLCVPSERSPAGYRLYSDTNLQRLQQVVVYRRLEVPLDDIADLLANGDVHSHLRRQRAVVMDRLRELNQLVVAIDTALENTMNDEPMTMQDMKQLCGDGFEEAQAEAEERWGDGDAWKESKRRTAKYTKDDWTRIKAAQDDLQQRMAAAFRQGVPARSPQAAGLVDEHRDQITRWFYDCSPQMQVELGRMYVSDPRFTHAYDGTYDAPGLSEWIRDAIEARHSA